MKIWHLTWCLLLVTAASFTEARLINSNVDASQRLLGWGRRILGISEEESVDPSAIHASLQRSLLQVDPGKVPNLHLCSCRDSLCTRRHVSAQMFSCIECARGSTSCAPIPTRDKSLYTITTYSHCIPLPTLTYCLNNPIPFTSWCMSACQAFIPADHVRRILQFQLLTAIATMALLSNFAEVHHRMSTGFFCRPAHLRTMPLHRHQGTSSALLHM
jgi:hypothetical protein